MPKRAPPPLPTAKPTAIFHPTRPRPSTLTLALPHSILSTSQTHDSKSTLTSSLARAAAVFSVDEIVLFADTPTPTPDPRQRALDDQSGYDAYRAPAAFLAHLLAYLECPPHLRRDLFPLHPNLRTAGSLASLDLPSHLKPDEWCRFREGVVREGPPLGVAAGKKRKRAASEVWVNTGLANPVRLRNAPAEGIPAGTRTTVRFDDAAAPADALVVLEGVAVAASAPREEEGYYWGYAVRVAESLSAVFTDGWADDGGYDYCIGTSERGEPVRSFLERQSGVDEVSDGDQGGGRAADDGGWAGKITGRYKHVLLAFGGVAGLERAVQHDATLRNKIAEPAELFDAYLNLVPGQGSRTIRTEEAVWCGLMGLRGFFDSVMIRE